MEVMVDTVMERDLLMLSQDMDTPPATNTDHHRDFPDTEVTDMVDMVMDLMVMEREMLSRVMDMELVTVLPLLHTIHMVDPALPIEAPRVFLDTAMVVMDTERDLLSPVTDMEADTPLSPKAVHTTMDPMDITLTTLMERDLPSPVMDMVVTDTEVVTAANTSPDHTPTMALMLLTLTKKDCQRKKCTFKQMLPRYI